MMVIIKALLELSEDLEKFGVFPKEMAVYSEIIPSFEKIWKDANENVTFSARFTLNIILIIIKFNFSIYTGV